MTHSGTASSLHHSPRLRYGAAANGDLRCHRILPTPNANADATTEGVEFSSRTPGPSRRRVALITGGALALAVGAVATSMAASPAPSASPTTNGTVPAPFVAAEPWLDEGVVDLDHGRFGGQGFREITITAISGSNVTLATDDGWTRTIAVTDAVDLTKGGQDIARVRSRGRRPGPLPPDPQRRWHVHGQGPRGRRARACAAGQRRQLQRVQGDDPRRLRLDDRRQWLDRVPVRDRRRARSPT